ncbi:MAG: glycosyltransferase family 9 protein [Candidatus Cloacimonetes bacterium]|nr:glycosyltransferase family 9 protein [Candidatus Cloacimonadota bacterium]
MSNTNSSLTDSQLKCIQRILIIQYQPFGDILLNTGYLSFLREKFPTARIDFLIGKRFLTLLECNPHIDNLIVMNKQKGWRYYTERLRIIRLVRSNRYDVVIDQIRNGGSAMITLCSGARYRLGWELKRWNRLYNYRRIRSNDRYYSLMKFRLLEPLGIYEQPHELYYHIRDASKNNVSAWLTDTGLDDRRFVVFSPGTPVLAKKWSLDSFAALADLIYAKYEMEIVLLWGPGEQDDCHYIAGKAQHKPLIALPTTFNEAGALLQRAFAYISQDGGINHVAVAMQTPSIALFGPTTNPLKWQAWHKPFHLYLRNYACKDASDRTLGITPEMVLEKFDALVRILEVNG